MLIHNGVLINNSQPSLPKQIEQKTLLIYSLFNFCGVNILTMANFKLPAWHHCEIAMREMCTINPRNPQLEHFSTRQFIRTYTLEQSVPERSHGSNHTTLLHHCIVVCGRQKRVEKKSSLFHRCWPLSVDLSILFFLHQNCRTWTQERCRHERSLCQLSAVNLWKKQLIGLESQYSGKDVCLACGQPKFDSWHSI